MPDKDEERHEKRRGNQPSPDAKASAAIRGRQWLMQAPDELSIERAALLTAKRIEK